MNHAKTGVLITGGTGLVGSALSELLVMSGMEVYLLSRNAGKNHRIWNPAAFTIEENVFDGIDFVVNLAGAGVADAKWTRKRKQTIMDSRVQATSLLASALKNQNHNVKHIFQASAVGYYGNSGQSFVSEATPVGNGFLANVCNAWERAADNFAVKTTILRIGVVLSNNGGALPKILQPVKWNLGAALGNGEQYVPWIHIKDLCRIILFLMVSDSKLTVVNATAPNPVTNKKLMQYLANKCNKLYLPINVPAFLLKLALGEMALTILDGQRTSTAKLLDSGFKFEFSTLEEALNDLVLSKA